MLMIVMSLAISLVPIQSFFSLPQSRSNSKQTSQSPRVQQEKKDAPYPTVLNMPSVISVTPVPLPPGDNAWAVQIVSKGGFAGSGRGDLTLTSEGTLIWNGKDGSCSRKLADETMQSLANIVLGVETAASPTAVSPTGLCADCFITAMLLQRAGTGAVRASSAIWDDVNRAKVPADLMFVYEALMAESGCKPQ